LKFGIGTITHTGLLGMNQHVFKTNETTALSSPSLWDLH